MSQFQSGPRPQQQQPLPLPGGPAAAGPTLSSRLVLLMTCLIAIAALQHQPIIVNTFHALRRRCSSSLTRNTQKAAVDMIESEERDIATGNVLPSIGWELDVDHPRYRLLAAMVGMLDYKENMEAALVKKMNGYIRLNSWQKKLLSPVDYPAKIAATAGLIATNDITVQKVLSHSLSFYTISFADLAAFRTKHRNSACPVGDHSSIVLSLGHFIRDWSVAGKHERDAIFPPILSLLSQSPAAPQRILVPGAGLSRLAYELAAIGHDVVANEYSYYQLMCARYILSLSASPAEHTFHPHINWWSHQRTTSGLQRSATFPDLRPDSDATTKLRIVDGDFTAELTAHEGTFDVVVTLFFIDTARNIIDYLDKIHRALRPGGTWINLGPLLYGTHPWVELSLDEVLEVVEGMGFELDTLDGKWGEETFPGHDRWAGKVRGKLAGYSWDSESLSRSAYQAQMWVAAKKQKEQ